MEMPELTRPNGQPYATLKEAKRKTPEEEIVSILEKIECCTVLQMHQYLKIPGIGFNDTFASRIVNYPPDNREDFPTKIVLSKAKDVDMVF